jgi:hypothetical protein
MKKCKMVDRGVRSEGSWVCCLGFMRERERERKEGERGVFYLNMLSIPKIIWRRL